jgi:chaperonin GroEL
VISVGAATETEMKQTKARMEDALHATRAAVEEGILPGGGVALLRAVEAVEKMKLEGDEALGCQIIARALTAPIRQIAANCGMDGAVVADEVRQLKGAEGFNAATGEYTDMLKAGILDPAKVVRSALSHAASISGLMLTTQVLITRTDDADGGAKAKVAGAVR